MQIQTTVTGRFTVQTGRLIDTPSASRYNPRFYEISSSAHSENRCLRNRTQAPWHEEICHGASARAVAYLQPHMHRLWADSRILHIAQGHNELEGLSGGGGRVQRANGLHLRRGTADL